MFVKKKKKSIVLNSIDIKNTFIFSHLADAFI